MKSLPFYLLKETYAVVLIFVRIPSERSAITYVPLSIKYHILEYLKLYVSSEAMIPSIQFVGITSFFVISNVGIKRVDCTE